MRANQARPCPALRPSTSPAPESQAMPLSSSPDLRFSSPTSLEQSPAPPHGTGRPEGTATPQPPLGSSPQTDVFIAMELMGTCAEKLKKRVQGPIPERILGKMTVAVS